MSAASAAVLTMAFQFPGGGGGGGGGGFKCLIIRPTPIPTFPLKWGRSQK